MSRKAKVLWATLFTFALVAVPVVAAWADATPKRYR